MRTIRYPRVEKFRNKTRRLYYFLKLALIWYILIGTGIYLTSNTNAAFNDIEVINNHFGAKWDIPKPTPTPTPTGQWDKSSLRFEGQSGYDCQTGFYQDLKNGGDQDMQGPSTYVVYFTKNGSPNKNNRGTELFRSQIPALKSGETIRLEYLLPGKPESGTYKFMAYQRPGHPGQGDLWGDEIAVTDSIITSCSK